MLIKAILVALLATGSQWWFSHLITGVRGLRGPLEKPVKKKKGFRAKLQEKYNEANAKLKESKSGSSSKKK